MAAAKAMVDACLNEAYEPGASAEGLYFQYTLFGDDPFIVSSDHAPVAFSAWDYAKARSHELAAGGTEFGSPDRP